MPVMFYQNELVNGNNYYHENNLIFKNLFK